MAVKEAQSLDEVLDILIDRYPVPGPGQVGNPDRAKLERVKESYDEAGTAKFLNDRGALSPELQKKYGLNRLGSNVSASEIPEEAPDYQGDVGLAADAGLKPAPLDPSLLNAGTEPIQPDDEGDDDVENVESYEDLSVSRLQAEIQRRQDEGHDIEMPSGRAKGPYVAALEDDDRAYEAD